MLRTLWGNPKKIILLRNKLLLYSQNLRVQRSLKHRKINWGKVEEIWSAGWYWNFILFCRQSPIMYLWLAWIHLYLWLNTLATINGCYCSFKNSVSFLSMCVCFLCECTICVEYLRRPEEVRSLRAGVTGGCEPHSMALGAGVSPGARNCWATCFVPWYYYYYYLETGSHYIVCPITS